MKNLLILLCLLVSLSTFAKDDKKQCNGKTVAGAQCSRNAPEGKSYCFQHDPSSLHCGAPTKSGGKCKRIVKKAGHCSQHSK